MTSNEPLSVQKNTVNGFYKAGFWILFSLLLLALGGLGGWWYFTSQQKEVNEAKPTPTTKTTAPTTRPTVEPTAEPTAAITLAPAKSDLELIQEAMATYHSKTAEETNITITRNNGTHASGGVSFEGEMGGGWFLATKVDGEWIIVDDGNGNVSCDDIAPYDFPIDMVPECIDGDGNLIVR